jgi:hypothetical protein
MSPSSSGSKNKPSKKATWSKSQAKPSESVIFWNKTQSQLCLLAASRSFLAWPILRPWRWRRHISSKRPLVFIRIHGVTSQRTLHNHRCENLKSFTVLSSLYSNFTTRYYELAYPWLLHKVTTGPIRAWLLMLLIRYSSAHNCRASKPFCEGGNKKISEPHLRRPNTKY